MLQHRRATAAAASAWEQPQPKEINPAKGRKAGSSPGNAADSGREGNSFAGKTNHPASQNPNNNVHASSREDLQKEEKKHKQNDARLEAPLENDVSQQNVRAECFTE